MPIGWEVTVVILCVAVIALAVIVLGLLRQVTPALARAAGPDPLAMGPAKGKPLPHFAAAGADGIMITDAQLRGRPAVLLFLSQGCGPCEVLAQEMRGTDLGRLAGRLIVVTGSGSDALGIPAGLTILTEQDKQVSDALSVSGTPFAIAVDPDGIVRATGIPNTVGQLEELAMGDTVTSAT